MKRYLTLAFLGALLTAATIVATPSRAMPLPDVVSTIRNAGGHYRSGAASLTAADCSGLVSVAQSLAMGQPVRRLGNTTSLLAGNWPDAIPGATPENWFIIGVNSRHMVASINGIGIEATTSGRPFLVGPQATSVWAPQFRQYHIDRTVLVLA